MSSDLGRRIGLTIGAFLVFRLGTYISVPGIEPAVWQQFFRQQAGGIVGTLDWFAGGAVARLSIFALSIVPFVTASVLLQLASIVLPTLRALPKRGESGRRRLDVYTLVLTILLAMLQALGIAFALEGVANVVVEPGMMFRLTTALTLTGGVIFLVWLAGQITTRGIGNGISLILAAGIVAALPEAVVAMLDLVRRGVLSTNLALGVLLLAVALTALIVHLELARRPLLVTFPRRQAGMRTFEGRSHLRLKLNNAGLIPQMLASWFLLLPILTAGWGMEWPDWLMSQLAHGRPLVPDRLCGRDRAVRLPVHGVLAQPR